ncbi:MAG: hypothetical protein ACLSDQ_09670 [Adlercreutzia equolifaciens]
MNRRCVLVASGDVSHKLKEDGPTGSPPEGPEFDRIVTELFAHGDLEGLFGLDAALRWCCRVRAALLPDHGRRPRGDR